MKKGNDKKNKKNRSFESNSDSLSPGDKKLGNSPKRSKKDNKADSSVIVPTNEEGNGNEKLGRDGWSGYSREFIPSGRGNQEHK